MREIKFRAWLKKDKKMVEVYSVSFDDWIIIHELSNLKEPVGAYQRQPSKTEPEYLMQYTGLKDKNGKDIYEGDIVKYFVPTIKQQFIGKIEFNEDFAAFWLIGKDWSEMDWVKLDGNFEVIGNIYENPELLKE